MPDKKKLAAFAGKEERLEIPTLTSKSPADGAWVGNLNAQIAAFNEAPPAEEMLEQMEQLCKEMKAEKDDAKKLALQQDLVDLAAAFRASQRVATKASIADIRDAGIEVPAELDEAARSGDANWKDHLDLVKSAEKITGVQSGELAGIVEEVAQGTPLKDAAKAIKKRERDAEKNGAAAADEISDAWADRHAAYQKLAKLKADGAPPQGGANYEEAAKALDPKGLGEPAPDAGREPEVRAGAQAHAIAASTATDPAIRKAHMDASDAYHREADGHAASDGRRTVKEVRAARSGKKADEKVNKLKAALSL